VRSISRRRFPVVVSTDQTWKALSTLPARNSRPA